MAGARAAAEPQCGASWSWPRRKGSASVYEAGWVEAGQGVSGAELRQAGRPGQAGVAGRNNKNSAWRRDADCFIINVRMCHT